MGRRGTGVEIRGNAIRVQFSLNGVIVRRTIRRDGKSQPPTSENLAEARRTAAEIRARIKAGTFSQPELKALTSRPGLNAKTVNNYVTVLRRAMELALANHAIEDNLVRFVRRRKQQLPFPDPFSRGEVEAIVEHMGRWNTQQPWRTSSSSSSSRVCGRPRSRHCGGLMST
jgi:integrase